MNLGAEPDDIRGLFANDRAVKAMIGLNWIGLNSIRYGLDPIQVDSIQFVVCFG